jgi:transcriptional regulator with XRE-family HTH domain
MEGFAVDFKSILFELRDIRRLSKTQLAKDLGTTRQLITAYENGTSEPNITMFAAMADYFAVSADYLLGRAFDGEDKTIPLPKGFRDYNVNLMSKIASLVHEHHERMGGRVNHGEQSDMKFCL